MEILIIGGSGGIGSALIKHLMASKPGSTIYATYHTNKPEIEHINLEWFKADASSESDIKKLSNHITSLDILVNTAGVLHIPKKMPEKSVNEFNSEFFYHNIKSNTLPTVILSKYFSKQLKSKNKTYFISFSARIGSIEDNKIGGWISYRCSKAALNMAIKTISIEWKNKSPNCCVLSFHPGTTDTGLSNPFQKNIQPEKIFPASYVATCLLRLLGTLKPADTGKFFSFDGEEIPW